VKNRNIQTVNESLEHARYFRYLWMALQNRRYFRTILSTDRIREMHAPI